jgi:hypothetical protein
MGVSESPPWEKEEDTGTDDIDTAHTDTVRAGDEVQERRMGQVVMLGAARHGRRAEEGPIGTGDMDGGDGERPDGGTMKRHSSNEEEDIVELHWVR